MSQIQSDDAPIGDPPALDIVPVAGGFDETTSADRRQDMLSEELHHRVQNTLAIVLALARLTARSCKTIEEFQISFGDRVQAMARTNALLLRGRIQAINVREAVEVELEPYLDRAVTLECEGLNVLPDAALSLSLLVHELATNAAKYGGLMQGGSLLVRCERSDAGGVMTWRETAPIPIAGDIRRGSGSVLIEKLARDLGGGVTLEFLPQGLLATVTFKLDLTRPTFDALAEI